MGVFSFVKDIYRFFGILIDWGAFARTLEPRDYGGNE